MAGYLLSPARVGAVDIMPGFAIVLFMEEQNRCDVIIENIQSKEAALNELEHSYKNITDIINVTQRSIRGFDPITFDYSASNDNLLLNLLKDTNEPPGRKPEYILLTHRENQNLTGNIFYKKDGRLIRIPAKIQIDSNADFAITFSFKDDYKKRFSSIDNEIVISNWDDGADDINGYQKLFDPKVREHVGTISNFVTYYSDDIAVIAFNYGKHVNEYDAQLIKGLVAHSNFLKTISEQAKITENAFMYTIEALSRAAEANDEATYSHTIRVNEYARAIAVQLKMPAPFINDISNFAQMHDIGKIHVNRSILRKPGRLTGDEVSEMQLHTIYGAKIIGNVKRLEMAEEIVIAHHDKFNGGGYPYNKKGGDIPLAAQITALADVYDALRSKRHYKPAFSHDKTYGIITVGDGRTSPEDFAPVVLDAFKQVHKQCADIHFEIQDDKIEHEDFTKEHCQEELLCTP